MVLYTYFPVLKPVILVLDLKPWPILNGKLFLNFLSTNEARLSNPSSVFAKDDFPTPCWPSMTNLGLGNPPCS